MSFPKIPNISPHITLTRDDAINLLLTSIAMEEIGLSHILNAEGEKIQYVVGTLQGKTLGRSPTIEEVILVDKSVKAMLDSAIRKELLLHSKLEAILNMPFKSKPRPVEDPFGLMNEMGAKGWTVPGGLAGLSSDPLGPTGDRMAGAAYDEMEAAEDIAVEAAEAVDPPGGRRSQISSATATASGAFAFVSRSGGTIDVDSEGSAIQFTDSLDSENIDIAMMDQLVILQSGSYMINYMINMAAAPIGVIGACLTHNSMRIPASEIHPFQPTPMLQHTVVLRLAVDDVITLQLFGTEECIQLAEGAGATMSIVQLNARADIHAR